jgi:hypothetical protein
LRQLPPKDAPSPLAKPAGSQQPPSELAANPLGALSIDVLAGLSDQTIVKGCQPWSTLGMGLLTITQLKTSVLLCEIHVKKFMRVLHAKFLTAF